MYSKYTIYLGNDQNLDKSWHWQILKISCNLIYQPIEFSLYVKLFKTYTFKKKIICKNSIFSGQNNTSVLYAQRTFSKATKDINSEENGKKNIPVQQNWRKAWICFENVY